MDKPMKRKQFHISEEDDKIIKDLSQSKGLSEAKIVREAIREYAAKNLKVKNPLLDMAEKAQQYAVDSPKDLSVNHDDYLQEIHDNENP